MGNGFFFVIEVALCLSPNKIAIAFLFQIVFFVRFFLSCSSFFVDEKCSLNGLHKGLYTQYLYLKATENEEHSCELKEICLTIRSSKMCV